MAETILRKGGKNIFRQGPACKGSLEFTAAEPDAGSGGKEYAACFHGAPFSNVFKCIILPMAKDCKIKKESDLRKER
jgi:hypothetical protein